MVLLNVSDYLGKSTSLAGRYDTRILYSHHDRFNLSRLYRWRVCWVLGPKQFITTVGQSGGFLDGGASHVLQVAAIPLLDFDRVQQDKIALQRHFKMKRDHVLKRLEKMGLKVNNPPNSTFYIWLDLSALPSPLNSGLTFFEEVSPVFKFFFSCLIGNNSS